LHVHQKKKKKKKTNETHAVRETLKLSNYTRSAAPHIRCWNRRSPICKSCCLLY